MSDSILVTGGAGAIGKRLVKQLRSKYPYAQIIIIDNDKSGKDIRDSDYVNTLLLEFKPKYIYHLVATFSDDYEHAYSINTHVAFSLLKAIAENKLATRVLLIGSAAEYGICNSDKGLSESCPRLPISVYGLTKCFQTDLVKYFQFQGVQVVEARIFNVFASGLNEHFLLGRIESNISELLNKKIKRIEVGPLDSFRDFIDINDLILDLIFVCESGLPGEVYNIGSGVPIRVGSVVKRFLSLFNLDMRSIKINKDRGSNISSKVNKIYANISKLNILKGIIDEK